jgi:iron complex transport system ATP-binding protein
VTLEARHLAWSYANFDLRIESLICAPSKITVVVGPNGAGKSTLLKCLGLIHLVRNGTIFVDGRDLGEVRGGERARLVGYVPQEPSFTFNYAVRDFVLTGRAAFLSPFESPGPSDVRLADEALRYVGLEGFEDRPYLELSSGERRLVLMARALTQESAILLLDEPTTFLDPRHELEIMELCRRLAAGRGKTLVVALHSLDMAVRYADELVVMKAGRVVASGPPAEVLSETLLRSVYEIDLRLATLEGRLVVVR